MLENDLNRVYNFCSLLKIECVKEEIESYLVGYDIDKIERQYGLFICEFSNNDSDIQLQINWDSIMIIKTTTDTIERVGIHNNEYSFYNIISEPIFHEGLSIIGRKLEKRENGIVITDIQKNFSQSNCFDNKIVLTDLYEKQYVFTKENTEKILKNVNFDNDNPTRLNLRFKQFEMRNGLKTHSDFTNYFSTHMNYCLHWKNGRIATDNIYSTRTYLNGSDISKVYEIIDAPDKLYRIHDLYNGIINPRNEFDINAIHLGLVRSKVFDLKSLTGVTNFIDDLIGKSTTVPSDYINYLKELFQSKYNYNGEIVLIRDEILKIIIPEVKEINEPTNQEYFVKKIVK